MTSDRTGLLIIRAWREEGSEAPLRAEIRLTNDVSTGFDRTLYLADVDAVTRVVRDWLAQVLHEDRTANPSTP